MIRKIGNITLATHLDSRIMIDGTQAVKLRVQFNGSSRYYTTNVSMTPKEYEKFNTGRAACETVSREFEKTFKIIERLYLFDAFSFDELNKEKKTNHRCLLTNLFNEKCNELLKRKKYGTYEIYKKTRNDLVAFAKTNSLQLHQVNESFIKKYIEYCKDKGNKSVTIYGKIQALKCILNIAVKQKLITTNPANDISVPKGEARKMKISEESLAKMLEIPNSEMHRTTKQSLLIWQFIYYGNGINVNDLLKLKKSDISNETIVYSRSKTKEKTSRKIIIPITEELKKRLDLLEKGKGELLLPDLENVPEEKILMKTRNTTHRINERIKKFCIEKEIPEHITTYTARHMFATNLLRKGVPIEYISLALGHSSIAVTERHYIEGYTEEQSFKFNNLL